MKRSPFLLALLALFACSKHHSGNSTTNNNYLSSVTDYGQGTKIIDSFSYDGSHRITSFAQYAYDSTSGTPQAHYWSATFTLPSDASQPASSYVYALDGVTQATHLLSYDAQGRIVKDSALTSYGPIIHFTYPSSSVAINVQYSSSSSDNSLDTLYLNNGNVTEAVYYFPNDDQTGYELDGELTFAYGSYSNPGYHSSIALNMGPLLHVLQINGFGGTWDFISPGAINSVHDLLGSQGSGPSSATYTQVGDSQGRLVAQYPTAGSYVGLIAFRYY